jgi:hypothetical protein
VSLLLFVLPFHSNSGGSGEQQSPKVWYNEPERESRRLQRFINEWSSWSPAREQHSANDPWLGLSNEANSQGCDWLSVNFAHHSALDAESRNERGRLITGNPRRVAQGRVVLFKLLINVLESFDGAQKAPPKERGAELNNW